MNKMNKKKHVKNLLAAVTQFKAIHPDCESFSTKELKRLTDGFRERDIRSLTSEIQKVLDVDALLVPFQLDFAKKAKSSLEYSRKMMRIFYYVSALLALFSVVRLMYSFWLLFSLDENSIENANLTNTFITRILLSNVVIGLLIWLLKYCSDRIMTTKRFRVYHEKEEKINDLRKSAVQRLLKSSIHRKLLESNKKKD